MQSSYKIKQFFSGISKWKTIRRECILMCWYVSVICNSVSYFLSSKLTTSLFGALCYFYLCHFTKRHYFLVSILVKITLIISNTIHTRANLKNNIGQIAWHFFWKIFQCGIPIWSIKLLVCYRIQKAIARFIVTQHCKSQKFYTHIFVKKELNYYSYCQIKPIWF